jgi:hypothetical protein
MGRSGARRCGTRTARPADAAARRRRRLRQPSYGGPSLPNFGAYDPATRTWTGLASLGGQFIEALCANPQGGLFVAAGSQVYRWVDPSWQPLGTGVGMNGPVTGLVALPNGNLLAAGSFTTADGNNAVGFARWNGTSWLSTNLGVSAIGRKLDLAPNGNVIASGRFTIGGVPTERVARWDGLFWTVLGAAFDQPVSVLLAVSNADFVAGGDFTTVGTTPANRLARWNGTAWQAGRRWRRRDAVRLGDRRQPLRRRRQHFASLAGQQFGYLARWTGSSWQRLPRRHGGGQWRLRPPARRRPDCGRRLHGGGPRHGQLPHALGWPALAVRRRGPAAAAGVGRARRAAGRQRPDHRRRHSRASASTTSPASTAPRGRRWRLASMARCARCTGCPTATCSPAATHCRPTTARRRCRTSRAGTARRGARCGQCPMAYGIAQRANGDLFVVGYNNSWAGARSGGTGRRRQVLGGAANGTARALAFAPNGDLLIGGDFSHVNGSYTGNVARLGWCNTESVWEYVQSVEPRHRVPEYVTDWRGVCGDKSCVLPIRLCCCARRQLEQPWYALTLRLLTIQKFSSRHCPTATLPLVWAAIPTTATSPATPPLNGWQNFGVDGPVRALTTFGLDELHIGGSFSGTPNGTVYNVARYRVPCPASVLQPAGAGCAARAVRRRSPSTRRPGSA